MIVAGIDPGKYGALFLLGDVIRVPCEVPLLKVKGKEIPDYQAWAEQWSFCFQATDHIFIEQVGAMPGQGVTSMFNFGHAAGFIRGLVAASGKPHTFLTPQKWKKIVGLTGDKDASRQRASQLMPDCIDFWKLKKQDGVAEAALIAWAGKQLFQGVEGNPNEESCVGRRDRIGSQGCT